MKHAYRGVCGVPVGVPVGRTYGDAYRVLIGRAYNHVPSVQKLN